MGKESNGSERHSSPPFRKGSSASQDKIKKIDEHRMSIVVNSSVKSHLDDIVDRTGDSRSEVTRKAIEFLYLFMFSGITLDDLVRPIKEIADEKGIEVNWKEDKDEK